MCRVTFVLPVYNVGEFIQETITSILRQTFTDFELLILDDCSTDDTVAKIQTFADPRIRLVLNPQNLGRAGTDNAALNLIRGEFVAKMDGDDICHEERLARQVAYLEQHPEVNVVGGWMQNFGASTYLNQYPAEPHDTRVKTLFGLPVGNPSVMLRTALFQRGMHYDAALRQTEDYDFFARYIEQLVVANLQEPLINYRTFPDIEKVVLPERTLVADLVREQLLRRWGIPFTARELAIHNAVAMLERPMPDIGLEEVQAWFAKIQVFNTTHLWFDAAALQRGLAQRWFEFCYTHQRRRLASLRAFYSSELRQHVRLGLAKQGKFLWKGITAF